MSSTYFPFELKEEWYCKLLGYNPTSLNKYVVGSKVGLWIKLLEFLETLFFPF